MIYYVAKSNRENNPLPYLCISSNLYYKWFSTLAEISPYKLDTKGYEFSTIQDWLDYLPNTTMTLLYSFTEQSNPELFV